MTQPTSARAGTSKLSAERRARLRSMPFPNTGGAYRCDGGSTKLTRPAASSTPADAGDGTATPARQRAASKE